MFRKSEIKELQDKYEKSHKIVRELTDDIASLKNEKKLAEEDIKHMVRIREEKLEVENERKQLIRDRDQQEAIANVKDEYRDKLEERLQVEVDNIKEMYGQILERLPTVTVRQHSSVKERVS